MAEVDAAVAIGVSGVVIGLDVIIELAPDVVVLTDDGFAILLRPAAVDVVEMLFHEVVDNGDAIADVAGVVVAEMVVGVTDDEIVVAVVAVVVVVVAAVARG